MLETLSGATRLYPILGDPIEFVKSPQRLTCGFAAGNHNGACVPMQVPDDALDDVMRGLTCTPNVEGLLITMPHKATAFQHCATSSDRARMLGVVSVMRRNADHTWHGDMLDGLAFVKAQRDEGAELEGAKALLVGAGAAGSAIAIALLQAGVGELVVHDQDEQRAGALVKLLAEQGLDQASVGSANPEGCALVFNATPAGLSEGDALPVPAAGLSSSMFAGDVIAGHGLTPFIRAARDAGCKTATGVQMVEAVQKMMLDFMLYKD